MTETNALKMAGIVVAGILGVFGIITTGVVLEDKNDMNPPACAEDDVIAGHGEYTNGKWERYACTHIEGR